MEEHGGQLAADFQRYYGLDLRDLFRPGSGLTVRRVLLLAEHLPEDSAMFASMRGGAHFRPWTTQTHLLAAAVNLLNGANHQRAGKRSIRALVKPPVKKARKRRVQRVSQIGSRALAALQRMSGGESAA